MSHIRFGAHAGLAVAFMVGIVALAGLRPAALAQDRVIRLGASLSLTGSLSDNGRLVTQLCQHAVGRALQRLAGDDG